MAENYSDVAKVSVFDMLEALGETDRIEKLRQLKPDARQSIEDAYDIFIKEGGLPLSRFLSSMACGSLLGLEADLSIQQAQAADAKERLDADQLAVLDAVSMVVMSRAIIDEVHISQTPADERPSQQELNPGYVVAA